MKRRRSWIRSDNILITIAGETRNVADWAKLTGRSQATIKARIYKGWDLADAVLIEPGEYSRMNLREKQRYSLGRGRTKSTATMKKRGPK